MSATDPVVQRKAVARARQRKALSMRLANAPLDVIAQECGYADSSGASRAIASALKADYPPEDAAALRTREAALALTMRARLIPAALSNGPGQIAASQQVLRWTERYARLMGLDAPVQVTVNNELVEQVRALAADLGLDGVYTVTDLDSEAS